MLPSETPLKPFSESYVDFALPIEVQSCDNAFYVSYSVCKKYFQFKGTGSVQFILELFMVGTR